MKFGILRIFFREIFPENFNFPLKFDKNFGEALNMKAFVIYRPFLPRIRSCFTRNRVEAKKRHFIACIVKQNMILIRSFLDDIKTKKLQRFGHFQRMEEGRLPKGVMKWRPP